GRKTIAQFNNLGNTVSVQDDEGRAGYWQYANDGADESNTTRQNQLTAASKLQDSVVNLLKNGDCERGDGWAFLGDTATGTMSYTSSQKYMGTKALQLSRTNSTGRAYIRQVVNIKPNTTYTLSAYMKASNLSGAETAGGSYGAGIMLECVPVEGQYKNIFSKTYWEDTDWVRLETTYTTPATLYHPYMSCYLTVGFQSGTAYFDCIQLEEAPTASRFNLVQNADFSFPGATANDALYWGKGSACTASEKRVSLSPSAYPKQDGYCFQITGIADNERRVYQDIPISGSTGDVYTLAGWAKGDSVPISGSRKFGLMLRFYETNGDPGDVTYVNFNPDMDGSLHSDTVAYTGWQFACGKIVAKKPYSKIRVMIAYEHNANTAWFDNIQLFKEEFGHSFVYDSQGNVTSATDILKKSSSYEWTDNDMTKMTLPTGASYTYSYDGHHNVTSASSATGVQSSFGYTAKGLNTSVKAGPASKPIESNATYDAFSRVSSITNPARKSINYEYDAQNRIVATKAPNDTDSTKTHTTYNNVGQVTQVSKNVSNLHHSISSPASASFTYENDRIKTMTHPGSIYTYNYGPFGVLASFMVGQHTMITHEYDTAGRTFNLLKSTYGNGDFVQYTYDHFDRITGIRFNGDTSDRFTFKYDNCGALAEVCDIPLDICTRTMYDFAGRPIKLTQTKISDPTYQWHAYRYEYDDYGRLSRFVEDAGNLGDMETAYTFDLDGRITQQTFGSYKHTWEYDSYGRLTTRKNYYNNNLVLTTAFTYFDPDGSHTTSLPASCTQTSSAGYSKSFTFQYDDNGNISEIAEVNGNRIRCAYNELNQLLRVDDAIYTYVSQYYFYDAAGNFVGIDEASVMFTPDMPDHTWGAGSYKYQDSQGWGDLITSIDSINHSHDEIGNLLSDGTWTYTWEGGKRLKSVSKDGTSLEFAYDAQGRRVSKKVNGASTHYDWVGNHITCLWNDSDELFFRYDADGHPVSLTFQGNDYFYLVNAQGDVMGIMDTSGNLVVEYQYDVWGALFLMSGSLAETLGKKNPLRYRGYIYDEETKLYYLVSRYYSPAMKRFISPDSYSVSSASLTSAN
ncbi:MAG: RHS repeat-associated core domain-containing protein, partial [Christensenellaceae bacterium]